ncbi:MAG: Trm112 family protein [Acidothermales bacterium]|nr:Trm112 family protein [Acidothermales bacterium]
MEPWVLELLACPACKSPLRAAGDAEELGCTNDACGLVYPVRDGVPVLLVDEARRP